MIEPAIRFYIKVRTVTESNAKEHWRAKHKRAKSQRFAAFTMANVELMALPAMPTPPLLVRMIRVGKRKRLDSDNLSSSMKHVRDGIADALRLDDGRDDVHWECRQELGSEYGVWVEIYPGMRLVETMERVG